MSRAAPKPTGSNSRDVDAVSSRLRTLDMDEHGEDISVEELESADLGLVQPPAESRPPPGGDKDLIMKTLGGKVIKMHREVWGRWSMSDYAAIKVRSLDYVRSGVKIPSPCPPMMEIKHLEIYQCEHAQVSHVCQYKDNWLQKLKASQGKSSSAPSSSSSSSSTADEDLSSGAGLRPFDPDFFFVVTFHVQTDPTFHLSMYFQRRQPAPKSTGPPKSPLERPDDEDHDPVEAKKAKKAFDTLFKRFIDGDTTYRNNRLKLIPFVVDGGNWFVTKAVGNRPAIIGNKMTTKYFCDPKLNYMEVNIDVSGSRLGSGIFRVVKGYASYLTLDLTLLIEGQEYDELPEVILGGCRLRQLDLTKPEVRIPPPGWKPIGVPE